LAHLNSEKMPSSIAILLLLFFAFFQARLAAVQSADDELATAAAGAATFPLQTRPFILEPPEEPFLVREGQQPGLVLNCSIGEQFRDRARYELEWTKVVGDTPK
jgi:hypothetical protein